MSLTTLICAAEQGLSVSDSSAKDSGQLDSLKSIPIAAPCSNKTGLTSLNYGDIGNVPGQRCTVITAGDPCQPFSFAGSKKGYDDDRHLWPAVLAVVERCKPDFFLGENVTGIANMVLSRRLDDLDLIGYQSKAFDIPACGAGLPTMERHIWTIASLSENELEGNSTPIIQGAARLAEWNSGSSSDEALSRLSNLSEPALYRSRKGIPGYVDRIGCLGNAIIPQIAQIIARAIRESINQL